MIIFPVADYCTTINKGVKYKRGNLALLLLYYPYTELITNDKRYCHFKSNFYFYTYSINPEIFVW